MQFGIFSVSDITPDPTTGRAPTEAERIKAVLTIAQKAEEVGLDVFALRGHRRYRLSLDWAGRRCSSRIDRCGILGQSWRGVSYRADQQGRCEQVLAQIRLHETPLFSALPGHS